MVVTMHAGITNRVVVKRVGAVALGVQDNVTSDGVCYWPVNELRWPRAQVPVVRSVTQFSPVWLYI
jgi:hypothetical protein